VVVNPLEYHDHVLAIGRVAEHARATTGMAGLLVGGMLKHVFDVGRGQLVLVDMLEVSIGFVVSNDAQEIHLMAPLPPSIITTH
jgi:ethanolamine utilization microcompartment shell protein EutL